MIDPLVRTASTNEVDQLRTLETEARDAVALQRGGAQWLVEHPPVGDRWPLAVAGDGLFIAHIDEVVVGYMISELGADHIVRIEQVWVTPEARELGFGDALLAAAIDAGRSRGAVAVEGQALPGDRHTKNLYERAGIVARLITTFRWL